MDTITKNINKYYKSADSKNIYEVAFIATFDKKGNELSRKQVIGPDMDEGEWIESSELEFREMTVKALNIDIPKDLKK